MQCPRCDGLMVLEQGWVSYMQEIPFLEQRCLNCGNILDTTIVRNRRESLCTISLQQQHSASH